MVGWLLAGLTAGIVWMLLTGWPYAAVVAAGLALAAIIWRRPLPAAALAWAAAGVVLCAAALAGLPGAEPYWGREVVLQLQWTGSLPIDSGSSVLWEARVLTPPDLEGGLVQVRTADYPRHGKCQVAGKLMPPLRYRNPGQQWHYRRLLCGGQIGRLEQADVLHLAPADPGLLTVVRSYFRTNIGELFGGDGAGLALAVTSGERNLLQWEQREAVYQAGLGHVTALSGMHIGVLAGLVLALLARIGLREPWSGGLVLVVLVAYVAFAGVRPSLARAVLMSGYSLAGYVLTGRQQRSINALGWAALAMLCYNPLWIADYSFLFSFAATACAVAGSAWFERRLQFLPPTARRIAGITLAVQLATLPLALFLFGGVPTLAVAANLVVVPLLPFIFAATLTVGFFGPLLPGIALPLAGATAHLCRGVLELARLLAKGWLPVPMGWVVYAWIIVFAAIAYAAGKIRRRKLAAIVLALLVAVAGGQFLYNRLTCAMWVLDVGDGDAVLLRCRGTWVLVDCGDEYAGEQAVAPALRRLGVRRLAALIITHPHADHAGGLRAVLEAVRVDRVIASECFLDSPWAGDVEAMVSRHQARLFPWLELVPPEQWDPLGRLSINNRSLVASACCNGTELLLAGDIEGEAERLLAPLLGRHTVLKVPHHGSSSSSGADFLSCIQPRTAIISCGLLSAHDFPHRQALDNLAAAGAEIFRTDRDGFVQVLFWPRGRYSVLTFTGR